MIRSPLIVPRSPVDKASQDALTPATSLLMGVALDDRSLLDAMASALTFPSGTATVDDLFQAMAARELLELSVVQGGPMLALTIAGIMKRFARWAASVKDSPHNIPRGTLTHLYDLLAHASGSDKILLGLQLGDQGLHVEAGYVQPSRFERSQYGKAMAITGYGSATQAAAAVPRAQLSQQVAASIGPLMQKDGFERRLDTVVAALRGIRERQQSSGFEFSSVGVVADA